MQLIGSRALTKNMSTQPKGQNHHVLHRRYSMQDQNTSSNFCKMEERNIKQQNQQLYTKYQQLFQLFKKKQLSGNDHQMPFEHVVTNELTKTVTNLHVFRRNKLIAKEWHKINYDRYKFMSKQPSVEKINTNRIVNIEPCLKVSQAGRHRKSQIHLNKIKTEQVCQKQQEKCKCMRSKSFQRDNLIIFLVDEKPNH